MLNLVLDTLTRSFLTYGVGYPSSDFFESFFLEICGRGAKGKISKKVARVPEESCKGTQVSIRAAHVGSGPHKHDGDGWGVNKPMKLMFQAVP